MCKATPGHRQHNGHTLALKKAMRLALENGDIAQKAVAIDLEMDEGTLSRYLSPDHPHALPVDKVPGWTTATGDAGLLRALTARCGYEIHTSSHQPISPEALQQLAVLLARQSGSSTAQLIQALVDGKIDDAEAAAIGPDLLRLQATVNALVDRIGGVQ